MIRKADYADIEPICRIETDSFTEPWSRASIEAEYFRDISEIFVVETDGFIVGYIIVWHIGDESELLTLAVDEGFRRQGIGTILLDYAVSSRAKSCDAKWFLEVACENKVACELYEKYGFEKTGIISDYYGRGKHAFRMARYSGASEGVAHDRRKR